MRDHLYAHCADKQRRGKAEQSCTLHGVQVLDKGEVWSTMVPDSGSNRLPKHCVVRHTFPFIIKSHYGVN